MSLPHTPDNLQSQSCRSSYIRFQTEAEAPDLPCHTQQLPRSTSALDRCCLSSTERPAPARGDPRSGVAATSPWEPRLQAEFAPWKTAPGNLGIYRGPAKPRRSHMDPWRQGRMLWERRGPAEGRRICFPQCVVCGSDNTHTLDATKSLERNQSAMNFHFSSSKQRQTRPDYGFGLRIPLMHPAVLRLRRSLRGRDRECRPLSRERASSPTTLGS